MKSRNDIRKAAAAAAWETLREIGYILLPLILLHFCSTYFGDSSISSFSVFGGKQTSALLIVLWLSFTYRSIDKAPLVADVGVSSKIHKSCYSKIVNDEKVAIMKTGDDMLTRLVLPPDVFIHVCSYLLPQEVTRLACVNQSAREMIDGNTPSSNNDPQNNSNEKSTSSISDILWKVLWYRDYGWLILDWDVGTEAFERSMRSADTTHTPFDHSKAPLLQRVAKALDGTMTQSTQNVTTPTMKDFFFIFGESYMNYILAGQNTPQRALLGLHSHIFDFTTFQYHHPGLADPIRLECGKDATDFFEDIPHSKGARKIARKLCIVANRSCCSDPDEPSTTHSEPSNCHGPNTKQNNNKKQESTTMKWGLFRPPNSGWAVENSNTRQPLTSPEEVALGLDRLLPMTVTKPRRANTLYTIRTSFDMERQKAEMWTKTHPARSALAFTGKQNMLGNVRVYYDPFLQQWKAWYTGLDFRPVYLDEPLDLSMARLRKVNMPWIQNKKEAQAAVLKLRRDIEAPLERSFDKFELLGCLSPIKALVGVSYFWKVQISDTECVQLRLFQSDENLDGPSHILAIKVARLEDDFVYLDPRDGYVQ